MVERRKNFKSNTPIEHDIPIPEEYEVVNRTSYDRSKYPFEMMDVGDSFLARSITYGYMSKKISQWQIKNGPLIWEEEPVKDEYGNTINDNYGESLMCSKLVVRKFRISEIWEGDVLIGTRVWCIKKEYCE